MIISENYNKPKPIPPPKKDQKKRADYVAWRDSVANELQKRSHFDEAERWDYCDNSPRHVLSRKKADLPPTTTKVWICGADSEHDAVLFSPSCDYRICPDCSHRHTARLMNRYIPAIEKAIKEYPHYSLKTITLTRSVELGSEGFKEAAQEGFELIQQAMFEVVGPKWKENGAGLLANWEVGPNGHKLHYHMVYFGKWVSQPKLSTAWKNLTGGDYVVWVSAVKSYKADWQGAISETLKYATKFYSEDKETKERTYLSPELTVDLFESLKGTRRIRSWGSFYAIEKTEERVFCCSDCKARMVSITIGHYELWRLTGFTEEGHRTAIGNALLKYRTANKSPPKGSKTGKSGPKAQEMFQIFEDMPVKKSTHYDYE